MANVNHVVTGPARLSYVHLNTPYAHNGNGDPKYSVTVLVPKTDKATKARIDAAVQAAIQQGVGSKWNGVKPPIIPIPVNDGDATKGNGEAYPPEFKGHWVFNISSKQDRRPRVVDINRQDILDPAEIYSGMYGRIAFDAYPYNFNGKKGVAFGLTSVQKTAEGQPLGSFTNVDEDFGTPIEVSGIDPITGMPL